MEVFGKEFKEYLRDCGADLVGFARLSEVSDGHWRSGISVAVAIPDRTIRSISDGPNMDYYDAYNNLNSRLDSIAVKGAAYLAEHGYHAAAQTKGSVQERDGFRTDMPHKTVAVHSGLGWIGKSALLVTEEYGGAVRLSSILTDALLDYDAPVTRSRCGSCMKCTNACPGKAISGKTWEPGLDRDEFFEPVKCRKTARRRAKERISIEVTLCGKCIQVCPYTQRYVGQFSK